MRLSDAIRLGAMIRPQGFGEYCDRAGHTCAIGAALEAAGYGTVMDGPCGPELAMTGHARNHWFILGRAAHDCPVAGCPIWRLRYKRVAKIFNVVVHLNDVHLWTREQIADWVASQEEAGAIAPDNSAVMVTV